MIAGVDQRRGPIARLRALFPEREVFLRSNGAVRFVRISARAQITVAAAVIAALLAWAGLTVVMAVRQALDTRHEASLTRAQAALRRDQAAVAAFQRGSGGMVDELTRRQRLIEALVTSRLGGAPASAPQPPSVPAAAPVKTSALPDHRALAGLLQQQDATARRIAAAFDARSAAAADTLRRLGLNPDVASGGRGGPLTPWPTGGALPIALRQLATAVERWSVLQDNLVALPSTRPTDGTMVTSSYGVRADPFTGAAAFHAGLDFTGSYGQAIRAAAAGTVAYVGQRQGYGNVVEIDHGNGLLTRYAHLSGFDVRAGERVARGAAIARMGSTGRSTGTHLHFEVRVGGSPVNPRRFLEAAPDITRQEIALVHQPHRRG